MIIGQIFAIRINFTSPETRMIVLPDDEDHTIVPSFLWTKHRNVMDRRTYRQICRGYYSGLHCEQCGHAAKSVTLSPLCCFCVCLLCFVVLSVLYDIVCYGPVAWNKDSL